jgi:hypothetical protein
MHTHTLTSGESNYSYFVHTGNSLGEILSVCIETLENICIDSR